jgi:isobutyryl-CoA mutase
VTATALFDGHDASINIMRRLLQQGGAEVIHLGHNRSVQEIVNACVQEDVQAVAISSYQGGHLEFFKYLREQLDASGKQDTKIFGGGGGVIIPKEIAILEKMGVTKIYSPEDGRKLGLHGIIIDMLSKADFAFSQNSEHPLLKFARNLTFLENKKAPTKEVEKIILEKKRTQSVETDGFNHVCDQPPVLGITGTGGAGKSSLTDEIIRRFVLEHPGKKFCIFSVDPSKKKTGGALLGDRIRMNAISHPNVFMRSFATRGSKSELSDVLQDAIALAKGSGFDLIFVETSGIGQGDTGILSVSDASLYVMTSEFGAATQLEKIDMLDFADAVAINKFDRRGSEDAFRDVKHQIRRSRFTSMHLEDSHFPVFGTIASKFNDDGVNALYRHLQKVLNQRCQIEIWVPKLSLQVSQKSSFSSPLIPQSKTNYLSEIVNHIKKYHKKTENLVEQVKAWEASKNLLYVCSEESEKFKKELEAMSLKLEKNIDENFLNEIKMWKKNISNYRSDNFSYLVRGKEILVQTKVETLSGLKLPRVAVPSFNSAPEVVEFLRKENFPGEFPYTAGVFPFKRTDEDPKRQFAGEGGPFRTNRRFKYLTENEPAKRLSTAFDSVTLYGEDPALRPDIFGKVGESGVSIASLDDMKVLFSGFDLCDSNTSVSMTINGPAPIILAFYLNAAADAQIEMKENSLGRKLTTDESLAVQKSTLKQVRGTVQADILKEDQAQNTCIFSTDFALKLMGDIQEFFIEEEIKNYYSVSISGYHIAEAGANPITQLAFTLANGFTYVEYYLSRGMKIDDFAPNLSFFFSNGMDPEYTVIGRVARRIWAIAMRDKYSASERSQKLKYHIQTSGRSLHAQEIDFNDIRTTLQAFLAISDNCNSLHTNAYDEAITTPTEESVRRSMAIQLILNREFGVNKNENPLQGSFLSDWLTDEVEKAVLEEFERISSRGGVLGAMETQYQRGKIQEESLYYETMKHDGSLPIIGVNTFLKKNIHENVEQNAEIQLARATFEEKNEQLDRVHKYQTSDATEALKKLQHVALRGENVFRELMKTVRVASLGQITNALYEVGGQYRRSL